MYLLSISFTFDLIIFPIEGKENEKINVNLSYSITIITLLKMSNAFQSVLNKANNGDVVAMEKIAMAYEYGDDALGIPTPKPDASLAAVMIGGRRHMMLDLLSAWQNMETL